jgi:short-subunit dehydrogenase
MIMAHAVLPGMMRRGRGAILAVSSMAGQQPMPGFGAYAATKAGVTSFAEMLSHEAGRAGVTVTALAPGGVRTEFSDVAGMLAQERSVPSPLLMDVEECAAAALAGLEAGRRVVIPKAFVRSFAFFGRHAPRAIWLPLCRRLMAG